MSWIASILRSYFAHAIHRCNTLTQAQCLNVVLLLQTVN